MTEKPLVSIVTPSYNQGEFIEDTILSVKRQNYPKIEHIVVDGGSTDDTVEILKKYEEKYNLRWVSEPDEGQTDAINKGFRMVKGDIAAWLNSDDIYLDKGVIEDVVNAFQSNPSTDILYGNIVIITKDNKVVRFRQTIPWISYSRLLRSNFIAQPSVFFRGDIIRNHKLNTALEYSMDYELWLRLVTLRKKFKHINRYIAGFRKHPRSKGQAERKKQLKDDKEIKKRYRSPSDFKGYLSDAFILKIAQVKNISQISKLYRKNNFTVSLNFIPYHEAISIRLQEILPGFLTK